MIRLAPALVAMTVASGTAAPLLSKTVPAIAP